MKNLFKYYLKLIWPIQRLFSKKIIRCNECLNIVKHKQTCEGCIAFKEKINSIADSTKIEYERFQKEINKSITIHKKYDFSFMLSGGKDSCYSLHRFKKEFPSAKILCILINNGFYEKVVFDNCKKITETLGYDLHIDNSNKNRFLNIFKRGFETFLENKEEYNSIDMLDGITIFQIGEEISLRMGIPNILCGMTLPQVENIVGTRKCCLYNETSCVIFPLIAWNYNLEDIQDVCNQHDIESSLISTNNILIPAICALDILKNGFCSFEREISKNIRYGYCNRNHYVNMFDCLTWMTNKGLLDKEIAKAKKILDVV